MYFRTHFQWCLASSPIECRVVIITSHGNVKRCFNPNLLVQLGTDLVYIYRSLKKLEEGVHDVDEPSSIFIVPDLAYGDITPRLSFHSSSFHILQMYALYILSLPFTVTSQIKH